jgi:hypothetical protein
MGDRRIRRDVSFKKGLSNEPTFGLIHLAGQYLLIHQAVVESSFFMGILNLLSSLGEVE